MAVATASTLILAGVAAKKLVEGVVADLYNIAKQELGVTLKGWKAERHIDTLYKRIRQLRLVKTIWQTEKEIDLVTFYHPSRVMVGKKRVVVYRLADLNFDGNVLIAGTVGQGKSIFLRHLAATEFCATRRLPVFVELRKLRRGQSVVSLALHELKALGLDMTEDVFHLFAGKGRLLLLVDAFDEVKEDLRQETLAEIETLARQHDALRIVVTSRPGSGIENSPHLRVFQLCPLEDQEYEQVVRRMANDEGTVDRIIKGIRKDGSRIAQLLTTPLMVALLMVRYRIDQSLPQNEAAFYDSLFSLLLQRHDKTKGGYIRPRKSGVSDVVLEDFFNALAFVTRKANETSFARSEMLQYAREAAKFVESGDIQRMLADIVEITCMIVTDGDEARFIHKSVQEYHAALFIKRQPDEVARKFYEAMETRWNAWAQELRFLEAIDRYRFLKLFHIPSLEHLFSSIGVSEDAIEVSGDTIRRFCGRDAVYMRGDDMMGFTMETSGAYWPSSPWCLTAQHHMATLLHRAPDLVKRAKLQRRRPSGPGDYEIPVEELLEVDGGLRAVSDSVAESLSSKLAELNLAREFVSRVEETRGAFDFTAAVGSRR